MIGQIYPLSFTIYPEHGGYLLLRQIFHIDLLTCMKLTNTLTNATVGWQTRQARAVPAPVARGRNGPHDHCPMPLRDRSRGLRAWHRKGEGGIRNGALKALRRSTGPRPGGTDGERASGKTTKILSRS